MPESLQLLDPVRDLRDSYRGLMGEFEAAGERLIPFSLTFPFDDFDALLARLERNSKGIDLPDGFVPNSTFWLVREGNEIVGVSNLRHRLNETLLREGGNIGSAKVIRANGGVLESEEFNAGRGEVVQRYWLSS